MSVASDAAMRHRGGQHKSEAFHAPPAIHPDVVRRVTQRRGGQRVFDRAAPARTAHVVVDLQNGFMAPGAVAEIPAARDIVPNVNRISAALRAAGGLVVYVQNRFDDLAIATWSTYVQHFCTLERRARMIEAFSPGAFGHALWPGLDAQPQDLLVPKRRFGAFLPGASDLHSALQARGIEWHKASSHDGGVAGIILVYRNACQITRFQPPQHKDVLPDVHQAWLSRSRKCRGASRSSGWGRDLANPPRRHDRRGPAHHPWHSQQRR